MEICEEAVTRRKGHKTGQGSASVYTHFKRGKGIVLDEARRDTHALHSANGSEIGQDRAGIYVVRSDFKSTLALDDEEEGNT